MAGNEAGSVDVGRDRNHVQAVLRACDIMSSFNSRQPEMSLQELSQQTGLNPSTVRRIVSTLCSAGFLSQQDHGRYRLGTRLFQLGAVAGEAMDLRRDALDVMQGLASSTGDTVFLLVAEQDHAMCIERVRGSAEFTLNMMPVGGILPPHVSAGGAVLLAYREAELLPTLLANGPTVYTERTVVEADALRARSATIRERGYSFADGDVFTGIAGYGAPVFGRRGEVVAALSIGGLAHRFDGERGPEVRDRLRDAAGTISRRMGYDG